MHSPKKLLVYPFNHGTFLEKHCPVASDRLTYIRHYLNDLGAQSVIEEPHYFDRDYLSEFSAFYGVSARGYSNICSRVHIFKKKVVKETLRRAISGGRRSLALLQENYLGFIVIRPVPESRFGRTVLDWYTDPNPNNPRVTNPSRKYECHLAGIPLAVRGLAWQQQDTGVAACATVALWTLLHSSAFDDHHAIPTTAEITEAAHRTASLGARVYPSSGLTIEQLRESIKENGLSPLVLSGEEIGPGHSILSSGSLTLSVERFAASCSAFIRSGYPVVIYGELINKGKHEDLHATVAVGFRPTIGTIDTPGVVRLQDGDVGCFYLHDDNLGPSVRFKLAADNFGFATLIPEAPQESGAPADLFQGYGPFYPGILVAAVHQDLRADPDALHAWGMEFADYLNDVIKRDGSQLSPSLRVRIIKQHKLLENEFGFLGHKPTVLARVKLALLENLSPMSLHIAQIRVGVGTFPLIDILVDTSDSQQNIFGHIVYHAWAEYLVESSGYALGTRIIGF